MKSNASKIINLDLRSRDIFKKIVETYLSTGNPIGSRTLSLIDEMGLSAATIRNVMQDLEGLGLIYSPHTSAGRIPTEGGLRLFVDAMLEIGNLNDIDQAAIKEQAKLKNISVQDALGRASEMLSGLTNCAGIVLAKKITKAIKHIEFVSLDKERALVVTVDVEGNVENRIIEKPDGLTQSALTEATNYLNHYIGGYTIEEYKGRVEKELNVKKSEIDKATSEIVSAGLAVWSNGNNLNEKQLIVRGASNLISDTEDVKNIDRIKVLFDDLENKQDIIQLLGLAEEADGVRIFIGSENKLFSLSGSSLIISPYKDNSQKVVGVLGVIGPTRLNYARVIPMVNYTAQMMEKILR
ncbi:MAG: heat-inducible transcriptional repressor HrcA [Rhodobiaceae bacterium]|jgi:heat-inducible transcriptional repressor|nr:heat-inducible transcriptional repressor HrcA [Rhodobiaceae bacterium]MBT5640446.1 heat-inducible transcriptional repressor HrcA [Rhodobiaceae bacterium]MBT6223648.1 heat-inducible transcriptional repressor HrcA [Rhodobiaceae bacterium]MDB4831559.1 heat-inducible transcriptional repressor HrcA [Hyphomicrobiales bacterium]|tara:strand:- start:2303 stop:3361 length:1059 start_codon:yes stop_codon:yes gene_type:complete